MSQSQKFKKCNSCGEESSVDNFNFRSIAKGYRQSYCKKCQREITAEQYTKNSKERRLYSSSYRVQNKDEIRARQEIRKSKNRLIVFSCKSVPCMDCLEVFNPHCMDFDHREGEKKKGSIPQLASKPTSKKALLSEIKKCDVVCANCHRSRTRKRTGKGVYRASALASLIDEAKRFSCLDCGNRFPSECMDFDHILGDKKFEISTYRNKSNKNIIRLQEEIKKCDLVCANCHRARTLDRRVLE